MTPYFSIIVPIYKVEKYLERCVRSILSQQYKDFEIILVDDGSPDNCGEICDSLKEKDNRIKVIHKKNGGLSSARNAGIKISSGEYLMFVDSDDYWDDDSGLEQVFSEIQKHPVDYMRMCAINEDYQSGKRTVVGKGYDLEIFMSEDINYTINQIFHSGNQPGSAWSAIIKKDFVLKNQLFFTEGIKSEDVDWIMNVMLHAKSIYYTDACFYVYVKGRTDSITGTADLKSITDILWIIDRWSNELENPKYQKLRQNMNTYLSYHLMCTVILYGRLSADNKKIAKKEIANRKRILRNLNRSKVQIAALIYKIFGIEVASRVLNFFH